MLDFYYILNVIVVFMAAYFWEKSNVINQLVKFMFWVMFIVNLLVALNHFGVLIFGKIPVV